MADTGLAPLEYHAENSRWVQISRGLDGVSVILDTFGWERGDHEQVVVSLDPSGGVMIATQNMSMMWDRAIASAGVLTGRAQTSRLNWTSSALNITTGAAAVQITYIDSDPFFGALSPLKSVAAKLPMVRLCLQIYGVG